MLKLPVYLLHLSEWVYEIDIRMALVRINEHRGGLELNGQKTTH
jgi:hypothetical protein